jgi:hypothetical protein
MMDFTTALLPVELILSSTTMESAFRKEAYCKPFAEEWERVRLIIRQLYIDEKKMLPEVFEIFGKNYNFHAL